MPIYIGAGAMGGGRPGEAAPSCWGEAGRGAARRGAARRGGAAAPPVLEGAMPIYLAHTAGRARLRWHTRKAGVWD